MNTPQTDDRSALDEGSTPSYSILRLALSILASWAVLSFILFIGTTLIAIWVSHHERVLISLAGGALALLLLCGIEVARLYKERFGSVV